MFLLINSIVMNPYLPSCCLSLGIYDLGCIGECINLEKLDLSANNISNVAPLATLRLLSVLNLSSNKISNLGKSSSFQM